MKLTAVALLKYNGPDADPYILGFAADLSSFGFFQRSTVREMMTFVARTVARKTQTGQRQTVQQEDYFCHAFNNDGLDPAQADKLTKIQRDLDETKIILHKTIESVLDRGEKLDQLVDKSADLSMASQMFYKQIYVME
ncbi:hypothetical protein N2152v2_009259 [Parachlorella kessleri]